MIGDGNLFEPIGINNVFCVFNNFELLQVVNLSDIDFGKVMFQNLKI